MDRKADREMIDEARPFVRSVLAFLLYLRFGGPPTTARPVNYNIGEAYCEADHFIGYLEKDLEK